MLSGLQAKPCKSLWVAGISKSVPKEELEDQFKGFGKIQEFKFIRDRNTAYIDFTRLEDASEALKNMNGKKVGGEQIRVDYLRSQPARRVSYFLYSMVYSYCRDLIRFLEWYIL